MRDNKEVVINLPENFINKMNSREAMSSFLKQGYPFIVDSVYKIIALKAGLKKEIK